MAPDSGAAQDKAADSVGISQRQFESDCTAEGDSEDGWALPAEVLEQPGGVVGEVGDREGRVDRRGASGAAMVVGHDAAAGVAGLIKAVLSTERGTIPGTLHFRTPARDLAKDASPFHVSADPVEWRGEGPRIAGVSAFGLGGNNAHVVLEQATAPAPAEPVRPRHVVTLSARTESELLEIHDGLRRWLAEHGPLDDATLADACYTLAVGRPHLEYRWAATVSDSAELAGLLTAPGGSQAPARRWTLSLDGSPDDLAEVGRRHLSDEPLFRHALERLRPGLAIEEVSSTKLGALCGLAALVALDDLGLTFGRVDAPRWARPVLAWWNSGRDPLTLQEALDACTVDPDVSVPRDGAARLVVGKEFDLAATVAQAWARGVRIDWGRYYSVERRGRIPLPTYPFARRRFWLGRAQPSGSVTAHESIPRAEGDVLSKVELVWRSVLGLQVVDHDAHFVDDLGGDSVYAVEIGAELGEIFHLELPVDLPFIAPTVTQAAHHIDALIRGEDPGSGAGA